MAATETAETVVCPLPGCDYEGAPSSVEGHISGKSDELHEGELGRNYREELRGDGAEDRDEVEVAGVDQWDLDPEESEESAPEESEEESAERPVPEDGGVPGIPLPMDKTTLALVAGLIVVLALLWRSGYFSDDGSDQEGDDQEETEAAEGAGLIG